MERTSFVSTASSLICSYSQRAQHFVTNTYKGLVSLCDDATWTASDPPAFSFSIHGGHSICEAIWPVADTSQVYAWTSTTSSIYVSAMAVIALSSVAIFSNIRVWAKLPTKNRGDPLPWLYSAYASLSPTCFAAGLHVASLPLPPIVHIPRDIQLSAEGHQAYARALDEHGNDVVIIPRHGRLEYVIDYRHVREVLTDASSYDFERAVTSMLHMNFMLWFKQGTFVQELNKLVQDGVTPRLRAVVDKIVPVFAREAAALREKETTEIVDVYIWAHRTIAQAMVISILGEDYLTSEMTEHFMSIVVAIANLAGIYENNEGWRYFSWLWSLKTTLTAIFGTVLPRFFLGVVPILWRDRHQHLAHGSDVESCEYAPFFDLLIAKHRTAGHSSHISFLNFIWCAVVCLGVIFASIHQTAVVAVWCILNLAQRQDEYLDALRTEWNESIEYDQDGQPRLTFTSLKRLSLLDSFIRETMRTKGDTFAPVRYTTRDVRVGKYIVPKGSLCAPYVKRAHEHIGSFGPGGQEFRGFQWHERGKPAVQGSHDFISFGLGRWACPGRHLAIAEIKLIIIALFASNNVELQTGTYKIVDPMNATSVAPEGVLHITPRAV